jgi:hypothetical protein
LREIFESTLKGEVEKTCEKCSPEIEPEKEVKTPPKEEPSKDALTQINEEIENRVFKISDAMPKPLSPLPATSGEDPAEKDEEAVTSTTEDNEGSKVDLACQKDASKPVNEAEAVEMPVITTAKAVAASSGSATKTCRLPRKHEWTDKLRQRLILMNIVDIISLENNGFSFQGLAPCAGPHSAKKSWLHR